MKAKKIASAYNEFRNNQVPYFYNQVQVGYMTMDSFETWFNQRESTFFSLMNKFGI